MHAQSLLAEGGSNLHNSSLPSELLSNSVSGGQGDADRLISLQSLIWSATNNHPLVRGAIAEVSSSEFDVTAAHRRRWPELSAVMESSGNRSSSANRALQLEQILWDGGQKHALVEQAREGNLNKEFQVALQKQQLALQVIAAWQSLIVARDKIIISEHSMDRLHSYQSQMTRRVEAQASPMIDLELVLSRIRQTEVDLSVARSNFQTASLRLQQLTGVSGIAEHWRELPVWPAPSVINARSASLQAADFSVSARESIAVDVARSDAKVAAAQLDAKRAERWPTLYARLNQPLGDASPSFPTDRSTAFFVGVRYTPGAGFATGAEVDALRARVAAVDESVEAAYLEQRQFMEADREELSASVNQYHALVDAVMGAEQVLESYSRQFNIGRKTWIDLLNAVRELAQNQYAQVEAQAAMASAFYRLRVRQGQLQLEPPFQ